jgi:N-acetylglucosaminyldiphosphoundecaprenol N-acetyl-beta-D-mannosaminyltransferase
LIIGLGQPLQEKWINDNHAQLNASVLIAVGDGIKVFAGEKRRGPLFMRKLGLEWLIRLFFNPFKYFNRYMVGIPVFLYRIIRAKLSKL